MNQSKLNWIDSLKGLGVIIIIIGHILYNSQMTLLLKMIYSFHVPLFFILSGFLDNRHKHSLPNYLNRRIKRIIFPYVVFVIISIPLMYYLINRGISFDEIMKGIVYFDSRIIFNEPLWYLFVLTEIYFVNAIININSRKLYVKITISVGLVIVAYICYLLKDDKLRILNHFGLNRLLVCGIFFTLGLILREINDRYKDFLNYKPYVIVLIFLVWSLTGFTNGKVSIYSMTLNNYGLFIIAGISGSLFLILLFRKIIDGENFLCQIGNASIVFLGTQWLWIVPYRDYMADNGIEYTLWYDLLSVVAVVVYILIVLLFEVIVGKLKVKVKSKKENG